ncbi:MAG: cysteine desulfurase [Erysipelotrichaceae bacterium]|nr:cysteine desulfurase [Erysipelotrichaceae bacterium]
MKVYLDAVSTTSLHPEVKETYKKLLDDYYCNSDALYDDGVVIYDMQEKAREILCSLLGLRKNELIFTSGASEANSLAIKGFSLKHPERKHLITSIYEHSSVYNSFKQLEENFGYQVTYLYPDADGHILPEQVSAALRDNTSLVSIMAVNNEIGAVNDIAAIAAVVKKHRGTCFHSDITQALGKIDLDLHQVEMASFSAHKIHGLKGSGALVKKEHIDLLPIISGGQQEFSLRGGTSNALTNIVLAKTLRIALEEKEKHHSKLVHLHDLLLEELKDTVKVNYEGGLVSLINISTPIPSEVLLNALNTKGIMVSSKSTCGSRENEPNRTLRSMHIDEDHSIRVSFDYTNTEEEVQYFTRCLKEILKQYV